MREDGEVLNPRGAEQWHPTRLGGAGAAVPPKLSLRVGVKAEGRGVLARTARCPWGTACSRVSSGAEGGPGGLGHLVSAAMAIGPWALLQPPGTSRSENCILSSALP